jgi:hypothetical protein
MFYHQLLTDGLLEEGGTERLIVLATAPTGPHETMGFGRTIHRIMHQIARSNPRFGPVLLGKYDVADGYYRIPLHPAQVMRLACMLPKTTSEEHLINSTPTIPTLPIPDHWCKQRYKTPIATTDDCVADIMGL